MNYIKKIEGENRNAVEAKEKALEAIKDLECYLESSKFNCGSELDGYVNVKDVLARLVHVNGALSGR